MISPNMIILAYLKSRPLLTALVGDDTPRIYVLSIPEGLTVPAITFYLSGGPPSNPYIPGIRRHDVTFNAWAGSQSAAHTVYNALYTELQGIQHTTVTIDTVDYEIQASIESVPGQDIQEQDPPQYHRVMGLFAMTIKCE